MISVTITLTEADDDVQMSIRTDDGRGLSMEHPSHVLALAMVHWALKEGEKENG